MKITKPKDNQILLEDNSLKNFNLEVKSKTGLNTSEFNDVYEALVFCYRQPNMDASKQMFYGDAISIMTLISSLIENLLDYGVLTEERLDYMIEAIKEVRGIKNGTK